MMTCSQGENGRTIEVMEFEHEKAELVRLFRIENATPLKNTHKRVESTFVGVFLFRVKKIKFEYGELTSFSFPMSLDDWL